MDPNEKLTGIASMMPQGGAPMGPPPMGGGQPPMPPMGGGQPPMAPPMPEPGMGEMAMEGPVSYTHLTLPTIYSV